MQPDFYSPERALVIAAHADDIEFGAAGTVTSWTQAGCTVTYCLVTDGGAGSNDPAVKQADLIAQRREEQIAAAAVVGVQDVRFLGYPDGTLQPTLELRRDLTRVIRETRPQLVITMDMTTILVDGNNYINHPDHRAVGEAALYAIFPSAGALPIFPELLAEGFEPHSVSKLYLFLTNHATLQIDVTDVYDRKVEALRCHKSQLSEEVIAMVRRWDTEAGVRVGMGCVESFRVLNLDETN